MALPSNPVPNPENFDLEVHSDYEDALDESESELKRLCLAAAKRLIKDRPRPQAIVLPPLIPSPSSTSKHKRSSSSEHSSIEKLAGGSRSPRATANRSQRPHRSGEKSSSSHSESPDDWRMVNYTFQEATYYSVLMQINQQMQVLSRQICDIEYTNSLQLKIIAQLLGKLIKARQRPRYVLDRFLRLLQVLFFVVICPFVVITFRRLFLRKQRGMTMNFLRQL